MSTKNESKKPAPKKPNALPGKRINAFESSPYDLVIIGLDTDDGPEHPLWDERANLELEDAFVDGILDRGVRVSVNVRKIDGIPYVVDGRQRVRGARAAMEKAKAMGETIEIKVPVWLVRGSDEDVEGDMILCNEHRVADDPLTKARKALRYIRHGHSEKETALVFKVSVARLRELLKLAESPKAMRDAVASGEVSAAAAIEQASEPAKPVEERVKAAKGKRGRGRPAGPSKPKVEKALARALLSSEPPHPEFLRALQWVLGTISDDNAGMDRFVESKATK